MYIIADSGSTKTEWCLTGENGQYEIYRTSGINPVFHTRQDMVEVLQGELAIKPVQVDYIYFYGAGCAFEDRNKSVEAALTECFGKTRIEVKSDLWGAARALCGDRAGIVCILGTGSNSCYYDGIRIVENVPPLGYILGDECSGAVLGRKLLADVLKGILPEKIRKLFFAEYPFSYAEWIDRVYRRSFPNRFLAGLCEFLYRYREFPEIERIVRSSIEEFIVRNVLRYETAYSYPVHFTGSVAYYFREQVEEVLREYRLQPGEFIRKPLEGLIRYHRDRASNTVLREG